MLLLACVLMGVGLASAQQTKLGKAVKHFENKVMKYKESKVDTNYIAYPSRRAMIQLITKNSWNDNDIYLPYKVPWDENSNLEELIPGLDRYEYIKVKSNTFNSGVSLGFSYLGATVGYTINTSDRGVKQTFEIGSNGNAFGFKAGVSRNSLSDATVSDYRWMPLDIFVAYYDFDSGTMRPFNLDEEAKKYVKKGSDDFVDVVNWYANAYYAFNHHKFSMGAGMNPNTLQIKSAGSVFLTGDVSYTRLHTNTILLGDKEKYNSTTVALGVGYGYNWTPNRGRLVVHASAMPMINVFNRISHTSYSIEEDGSVVEMEDVESLRNINDKKMKLSFSGQARLGVCYYFNEWLVGGGNVIWSARKCLNASDSYMYNERLQLNAYVGYRF